LFCQQRPKPADDGIEAAPTAFERALAVMRCARSIQAHGDSETERIEEIAILRRYQRAVGGDGKSDFLAAACGADAAPLLSRMRRRVDAVPASN